MTYALEALNWHSDRALVERNPAPLNLTDTEVTDWLDEYADLVQQVRATRDTRRVFVIECDMISTTRGGTLREAVCLAAAKLNEVNE